MNFIKSITKSIVSIVLVASILLSWNISFTQELHHQFLNKWEKEQIHLHLSKSPTATIEKKVLWKTLNIETNVYRGLIVLNSLEREAITAVNHTFLNQWEKEQVHLLTTPNSWTKDLKRKALWKALDVEHEVFVRLMNDK